MPCNKRSFLPKSTRKEYCVSSCHTLYFTSRFLFLSCSSRTFPRGKSKRLHFTLAKRASVFAGFSRLLAFDSFYPSVLPVFFFSFNKRVCIRVHVSAQLLGSSGSQHQSRESILRERELFMVLKMSRRRNGEHNYLYLAMFRVKTMTCVEHPSASRGGTITYCNRTMFLKS